MQLLKISIQTYQNDTNHKYHHFTNFYKLYYDMKGYVIFDKNYLQSLNRVIKKYITIISYLSFL